MMQHLKNENIINVMARRGTQEAFEYWCDR